jgi:hypothetical protein
MLENDFTRSRLMDPGEYDAKPWWFRFAANLARLTSPVQLSGAAPTRLAISRSKGPFPGALSVQMKSTFVSRRQ